MFNRRWKWNRGKRGMLWTWSAWQLPGTYLEQGIPRFLWHFEGKLCQLVCFWNYALIRLKVLKQPSETFWGFCMEFCSWQNFALGPSQPLSRVRLTKYSENIQKGRVGCTRIAMVPSFPAGTTAPWSSTICSNDRHSRSGLISSGEHLLQLSAEHRRDGDSTAFLFYPQLPYIHVPSHHKGEEVFPKSQV